MPFPTPRATLERLEALRRAGVTVLPRVAARPAAAERPEPPAPLKPAELAAPAPEPVVEAPPTADRDAETPGVSVNDPPGAASTLEVLQQQVAACTACQELAATRNQTVFGVGNPDARLCFLGEAPGADEDRLGEPFVGRAGQLLTRMLSACGLTRADVYILNVLKCRPPGNRNPAPDEVENCQGFLTRQLDLIDPEFVCCLGAVAAQNFLETTSPIGRLRGKVHEHRDRKVVCTYHPAYLLRNPSAKRPAWEDLQMLMHEMGIEIPG